MKETVDRCGDTKRIRRLAVIGCTGKRWSAINIKTIVGPANFA
jgi:hypothetical protein